MRDIHFAQNHHTTSEPQTCHATDKRLCSDVADQQDATHMFDLNLEANDEHPWSAGRDLFYESVGEERPLQFPHESLVGDVDSTIHHTVGQVFKSAAVTNILKPWEHAPGGAARGSCFVVDTSAFDGLNKQNQNGPMILTNHHVVKDQVRLEVGFPAYGDQRFEVELVATAPQKDLALLKLVNYDPNTCSLRPYILGDSDHLQDSVSVIAEGYPLGQTSCKVTQGTLSGVQTLRGAEFLQHTAFLNGGNSGGPLSVQTKEGKRVVGMNSMIIKGGRGMNYAIPVNAIRKFMQKIDYSGKTVFLRSPYMGLFCEPSNANQTALLNHPQGGGYYVNHVVPRSVAAQGLKKGDQIFMLDGHRVDMTGSTYVDWSPAPIGMNQYLSRKYIGDTANFQVYRDGGSNPVSVDLTFTNDTNFAIRSVFGPFEKFDYEVIGGMVIQQLTQNHIAVLFKANLFLTKYMFPDNLQSPRLIVTHLFPGSVSERQHVFSIGTILSSINGQPVESMEQLRNYFKSTTHSLIQFTTELDADLVLSNAEIKASDGFCNMTYNVPHSSLIMNMLPASNTVNHIVNNSASIGALRQDADCSHSHDCDCSPANVTVRRFEVAQDELVISSLQSQIDTLTAELASAQERSRDLDLSRAREDLCSDKSESDPALRSQISAAAEEISCAQETIVQLQETIGDLRQEAASLNEALSSTTAERDSHQDAIRILHEQLHSRQTEAETETSSVAAAFEATQSDELDPLSEIDYDPDEFIETTTPVQDSMDDNVTQPTPVESSISSLTDPLGLLKYM